MLEVLSLVTMTTFSDWPSPRSVLATGTLLLMSENSQSDNKQMDFRVKCMYRWRHMITFTIIRQVIQNCCYDRNWKNSWKLLSLRAYITEEKTHWTFVTQHYFLVRIWKLDALSFILAVFKALNSVGFLNYLSLIIGELTLASQISKVLHLPSATELHIECFSKPMALNKTSSKSTVIEPYVRTD